MRDILVTLLVFGSLPFILRRPYIGILVWSWLSYMNPHKLAFGFAFNMPFAQIVALTLFAAILFSKDKLSFPKSTVLFVWVLFIFWMVITTFFAIYPDSAMQQLEKVLKIQLITFLTLSLINDWKRLDQLIWVIVLSIGYFSVKGGLYTIRTGGSGRVWGPPGGFIQENNSLALATLMIIPLLVYLYHRHRSDKRLRIGLGVAIFLSTISVVGSQSRGAYLGIIAVAGFFWLKTKGKIVSGIAIIFVGVLLVMFMPESWHNRMGSIGNYQEDKSAMGRINAWQYAINVASDRVTGAGFESWSYDTFVIWAPRPEDVHVAHSIFFSVLADHGWLGLLLFLTVFALVWRSLSRVVRLTDHSEDLSDQNMLARMLQVSFVAYFAGGAFLSLSYFDLPWHLVAITLIISHKLKESDMAVVPRRNTHRSV